MKKLIFLFIIFAAMLSSCSPKLYRGSVICNVELVSEHSSDRVNAISLNVHHETSDLEYPYPHNYHTIAVQMLNNTDYRLFIEWEHSRINLDVSGLHNYNIGYLINDEKIKVDEAISPNLYSLNRYIICAPDTPNNLMSFYDIHKLRQGTTEEYFLKIPIRFPDGSVEEYIYRLKFYWQNSM